MRWSIIRWSTVGRSCFRKSSSSGARLALEDRLIAEVTLPDSARAVGGSGGTPASFYRWPCLTDEAFQIEGRWGWLGYFAALGLGFIMVEIALLQLFLLFLGQPIYTYAVVLAGLLVFTGIGSHAAGRWVAEPRRVLKRVLVCAIVLVMIMAVTAPVVFSACLGLSISWRIAIALLLVAPLGFVLAYLSPWGFAWQCSGHRLWDRGLGVSTDFSL